MLAVLLYVRFFRKFFRVEKEHSETLQAFIAIMATTMPMLERMTESKIKTPEAYLWTKIIMSYFKSVLMCTVFVVNGIASDFYIGMTLFCHSIIGCLYFQMNPYKDPRLIYEETEDLESISKEELKLFELALRMQYDKYSRNAQKAFKYVSLLTVVLFMGMALVTVNSPEVPIWMLELYVQGSFEVTSLSITAVIIILYNLFAWTHLMQSQANSKNIKNGHTEMERIKLLCELTDNVSRICSTIDNSIEKSVEEQEDKFEKM